VIYTPLKKKLFKLFNAYSLNSLFSFFLGRLNEKNISESWFTTLTLTFLLDYIIAWLLFIAEVFRHKIASTLHRFIASLLYYFSPISFFCVGKRFWSMASSRSHQEPASGIQKTLYVWIFRNFYSFQIFPTLRKINNVLQESLHLIRPEKFFGMFIGTIFVIY